MSTQYTIEMPAFSGPLDLLLHLINRNELDITAISLATVTKQYLDQIKQLKSERIEHLIDFLAIGARLVLIKSRALLPKSPTIIIGETDEEEDPAEQLARQLRRYKQFKEMANWLAQREKNRLRTHLRIAPPLKRIIKPTLDLAGVTPIHLHTLFLEVLERMQQVEESVSIVEKQQITVSGQINHLRTTFKQHQSILFRDLLSQKTSNVELAVTLLAMLELIKRQELTAVQEHLFGPIHVSALSNPIPNLAEQEE